MFEFASWLGATPLSVAIQSSTWLTPLLQAIHILMIGVVFVSMLMIALRVFGLSCTDETFDATWQRFAPWMWRALLVMLLTGVILVVGEPSREAKALSFWLKMGLILVAVVSVSGLRKSLAGRTSARFSSGPRMAAAAIIVLWVAIVFLGRAIAYDTEVWGAMHLGAQS